MTQNERILEHLKKYGTITQLQAMNYGIMRLPSRIHELKRAGYNITAKMTDGKNRYGEATHYAIYTLEQGG